MILRSRLLVLVLFAALLTGCRSESREGAEVVVTLSILRPIVQSVAAPGTHITVLLPPGTSPHAYEPRPSDLRLIQRAQLVVGMHPDIDGWAPRTERTVRLSDWLSPDVDPHLWLDPVLVADALPALAAAVCDALEQDCAQGRARSTAQIASLQELDAELRSGLGPIASQEWVISGPFLAALFDRYGISRVFLLEPVEGVEATPSRLRDAIRRARDGAIVIAQTRLPEEAARTVAATAGAPLILVDPVGDTAEYATFLRATADSLIQGAAPHALRPLD